MREDFDAIYERILNNIKQNPQEIHTIPLRGGGVWFSVFVKNERIFVSPATEHTPASKVLPNTPINKIDLERMFPLYVRRKNGEQVSQEAQRASRVIVYCYAIFENYLFAKK